LQISINGVVFITKVTLKAIEFLLLTLAINCSMRHDETSMSCHSKWVINKTAQQASSQLKNNLF